MKTQLIYKNLAGYYDAIYEGKGKDYQKEADKVKNIIRKYKVSMGNRLLDVGCGTAKHMQYFEEYECWGLDINKEMIDLAKKNVKNARFLIGDMQTFQLKEKFDVIVSLFSAIGYVKSYSNLKKTIKNFYCHLNNGGVVILEPWLTEGTFDAGKPSLTIYNSANLKIARGCVSKKRNNLSILDMNYLILERGKEIRYFVDRHELGLFETDKFLNIMKESGFQGRYLKNGLEGDRGLYVGVKNIRSV